MPSNHMGVDLTLRFHWNPRPDGQIWEKIIAKFVVDSFTFADLTEENRSVLHILIPTCDLIFGLGDLQVRADRRTGSLNEHNKYIIDRGPLVPLLDPKPWLDSVCPN
jgi:hypothetical protein